jgi:hypothetical protein
LTTKIKSDDSITVEAPELENVFNYDKEEARWQNQYMDAENKIPYFRWKPVEQTTWENFRAKCIDPKSGKWFRSGEGTGLPKASGEVPRRYITSIIRLKTVQNGVEYLLSYGYIRAFNQWGDPSTLDFNTPEKYVKTSFAFENVPNYDTGYAMRVNTGPCGTELIYALPFTKENAHKLFEMRDGNNIQFSIKDELAGKVVGIKPQTTVQDSFKLFVESDFSYLINANYLSVEEKMMNMKAAVEDGLIPNQSDDERKASLIAQRALSQKDKMVSYG